MAIPHKLLQGSLPRSRLLNIRFQQTRLGMSRRDAVLSLQRTHEVPQGNGHSRRRFGVQYIGDRGHMVRHERGNVFNTVAEAEQALI